MCAKECSDILARKNNPRKVIDLSFNLNRMNGYYYFLAQYSTTK
jgi:hypothetical protein